MSHTNETLHYGLSQYIGTDIINPLTDMNGDNAKIDEALYDANSNASEAKTTAQTTSALVETYEARIEALEQGGTGDVTKITDTQAMIAPPFDKLKSGYAVGDKVTYNDKLYVFTRQHVGDWDENDVTSIDVVDITDGISNNVSAINVNINRIDNTIADIQSQIGNVEHRRFVVISDSYGVGRNNTTPWITYLSNMLNVEEGNFYGYAEGSMGFARTGEHGNTAITLLTSHANDIAEHETITDIVFGMGLNDYAQAINAINGAIDNLVNYCRTTYPNATIWFGYIGNSAIKTTVSGMASGVRTSLMTCNARFIHNKCKVMNGIECISRNVRNLQSDGVHPTNEGGQLIAEFAYNYLLGGHPVYMFEGTFSFTGAAREFNPSVHIYGDITTITYGNGTLRSAVTLDGMRGEIGQMSDPIVIPSSSFYGSALAYVDSAEVGVIAQALGDRIYVIANGSNVLTNTVCYLPTIVLPTLDC